MDDFKDFLKDLIGFIIMMLVVFVFINSIGVKDWSSYIVGLCVGFFMPIFMTYWTKFTNRCK